MVRRMILIALGVCFVLLIVQRITRYATYQPDRLGMPPEVADAEERDLFGSPAGVYLQSDIAANGSQLPSQRFHDFRARHDIRPLPGDRLCPITRTKAAGDCTWIINNRRYEFCCPPCIAEFVRQAKEQPESILPPEQYVMPRE